MCIRMRQSKSINKVRRGKKNLKVVKKGVFEVKIEYWNEGETDYFIFVINS